MEVEWFNYSSNLNPTQKSMNEINFLKTLSRLLFSKLATGSIVQVLVAHSCQEFAIEHGRGARIKKSYVTLLWVHKAHPSCAGMYSSLFWARVRAIMHHDRMPSFLPHSKAHYASTDWNPCHTQKREIYAPELVAQRYHVRRPMYNKSRHVGSMYEKTALFTTRTVLSYMVEFGSYPTFGADWVVVCFLRVMIRWANVWKTGVERSRLSRWNNR